MDFRVGAVIALALCEKPAAEADVDGGCHLVACEYPQLDAAILQVSYRVGNAVLLKKVNEKTSRRGRKKVTKYNDDNN